MYVWSVAGARGCLHYHSQLSKDIILNLDMQCHDMPNREAETGAPFGHIDIPALKQCHGRQLICFCSCHRCPYFRC